MSQAYASNAEAVNDYLKNYTDEQINTIGEMVSNESNIALSEWRDKAEKLRAQGEANIESGGEALGGILGIKGIGKGIKKVKDLYKKGQEAKKAAEDAVKKAKDTVSKGKDSVEKIKKDLEDKTKSRNDKAKENNEGEDGTADIDEDSKAFNTTPPDEDTDKPPSTEQEGGNDTVNQASQEGQGDAIGQEGGAVEDSVADSEAFDTDSLLSRIASARANAQSALDDSPEGGAVEDSVADSTVSETPELDAIENQSAENIQNQLNKVKDIDDFEDMSPEELGQNLKGDVSGVNLDDIFDNATGGTEKGVYTSVERVVAKNPYKLDSRIGDGDVESVLQRPTKTTLNQDTEPTQETSFDSEYSFDQTPKVGGESEMNVYSNTAPRSYNVETNSASGATENTSLENTLENASEQVPKTISQSKPVSLDSPQPDAPKPKVKDIEDLTEDTESPLGQDILQLEGLSDKATLTSSDLPFAPASSLTPPKADPTPPETDTPDVIAEPLEDTGEPAGVDIGEYASKITSSLAKRGASIRQQASSAYQTVKKKVLDEPEESGGGGGDEGEDGAEDGIEDTVAEDVGDDVGSGLADVALGAIPVVGELAAVGGAIYGIYSGLEDLFGSSSDSKPPKTKTLGTTLAGGNPLTLGDNSFANKLTTGIATHEDAQDIAGSLSF